MAEQAENARIRAFLAVRVAAEIEARLVEVKRELAATEAAVRWVRDDGLHATVKFLGASASDVLDAVRDSLRGALAEFPSFAARVADLGAFPNLRRPRVLWAGMHAEPLARMAAVVDETAAGFGFAAERRPFHCHVTLGRVSTLSGWQRLEAAMRRHARDDFGSCAIDELIAFRSDLRPGGAVYTKLWTISFAPDRTIATSGG